MKQGDFKCSLQLSSILGASRASNSNEMIVSQYEDISNLRSGCFQSCTYKERGSDRVKRKHMFFFKTKESCTEWTDRINASLGIIAGKRRKFPAGNLFDSHFPSTLMRSRTQRVAPTHLLAFNWRPQGQVLTCLKRKRVSEFSRDIERHDDRIRSFSFNAEGAQ